MAGNNFTFKQFTVRQEACAMKVGTDGVLIGAWASGGHRILDIGTGTGLIALMMAQRFSQALITAIDIDHEACAQARDNASASPFGTRIEVLDTPLQAYTPPTLFDSIVSNPPYFQNSLRNPDARKAAARHSDSLPFGVLFSHVARLLSADGVFSAVVPTESVSDFIAEGSMHSLSVVRRCDIRTTPRKPLRRCLLSFARHCGTAMERSEQTLQTADGTRSEWYAGLTADFYIK